MYGMNTEYLEKNPSKWNINGYYLHGKQIEGGLNVVNETAESGV